MPARRARALTLAVVAGFALAALPPAAAQAAVVAPAAKATKRVAVTMGCTTFSTTVPWSTTVVTKYTKVAVGKKSKVTIAFSPNYRTGPVPITANSLRPVLSLKVNGKAKTVTGTANPTAVGPNTVLPASTIAFKFKVKNGKNKIQMSKVVWDHAAVDTPCIPPSTVTLAKFTK
jgi:hypothetical protein